jgi:hypothetical protein
MIGACAGVCPLAFATDGIGDAGKTDKGTSLEERLAKLEATIGMDDPQNRWLNRIHLGGLIEVEAGYGRVSCEDPTRDDDTTSYLELATVELGLDADIVKHVTGHVLFKYRQERDLFVDEGYIAFTGTERFPAYLKAGRQYLPFGHFESHFITDPLTLLLGETNEDAVVAGYRIGGETIEIAAGGFTYENENVASEDSSIEYTAAITVSPLENVRLGVSYTSQLAAAYDLANQVQTRLSGDVDAWSVFASVTLVDRITLSAEYLAALDDFRAGELYSGTDRESRRPAAWNLEAGVQLTHAWMVALRYGGSSDGDAGGGEFLPERQYGAVVSWQLFEHVTLAAEYLHCSFPDDYQSMDNYTVQLAAFF